jgi:hypothetical protein
METEAIINLNIILYMCQSQYEGQQRQARQTPTGSSRVVVLIIRTSTAPFAIPIARGLVLVIVLVIADRSKLTSLRLATALSDIISRRKTYGHHVDSIDALSLLYRIRADQNGPGLPHRQVVQLIAAMIPATIIDRVRPQVEKLRVSRELKPGHLC